MRAFMQPTHMHMLKGNLFLFRFLFNLYNPSKVLNPNPHINPSISPDLFREVAVERSTLRCTAWAPRILAESRRSLRDCTGN